MNSKVLASVGGIAITEMDVEEYIRELGQRGAQYNSPEGRRAILQQLVNHKLLLLEAQKNLFEAEGEFRNRLAKVKEDLLINYAAEKAISRVSATEEELLKYYNDNIDKLVEGDVVGASHILVDSEETALSILAKITSGEITFEDAAREYSSCPSGQNGGSLGEFARGQMVPEFDEAVFAMTPGEISKAPVKTQFGFHLIKCTSRREAEPVPFAEVHDELMNMLLNEKRRAAFESKINQLKIMFPVDYMSI